MSDETREKRTSDLVQVRIFVGFIAAVIAVVILKELKNIFIPIFMALLLYFLFNGAVRRLVKFKIPRALVLIFLLIFIFIVFYLFGVLIYAGVSSFVDKFPTYSDKITATVKSIFDQIKLSIPNLDKYIANLDWTKSIDPSVITSVLSSTFGSFAVFIGNLVLVLIFLMFMLASRNALTGRMTRAFDEKRAEKITFVINSIENQVQNYLLIKTFISCMNGVICGFILFAGQFDFVVFSALLIFMLNYIPNFGSVFATLVPISIGLLKFGFSFRLLAVTLGLMATQFTMGNVVEPKLAGRSLDLSPIVILVSLIFWGYVWGVVGMILAIPLTSALKICFENIPELKPFAELIGADHK